VRSVFPDISDFLPAGLGLFVEVKGKNLALRVQDLSQRAQSQNPEKAERFVEEVLPAVNGHGIGARSAIASSV
jgi:hypothetical protein